MPGGVCAVLDYDVELMTDYVAEMAVRLVMPDKLFHSPFRKFVSQVLSSTRLPSTTILLGMNYLAKRVALMSISGDQKSSEGQVWRMLTIALLLGSKFLDDNTFQNKSWSEVSGIPVHELNALEYEWLNAIRWNLYVNLDDSDDFQAWLSNWCAWLGNKKRQEAQATRLASLKPLKTSVDLQRPRNPNSHSTWHQQQVAEYERLSSLKHRQPTDTPAYQRDPQVTWGYTTAPWLSTPLTPPDSGYGTPEYVKSTPSVNGRYDEWFGRAIASATLQQSYQQPPNHVIYPTTNPGRSQGPQGFHYNYKHSTWESISPTECNCVLCVGVPHKSHSYFAQLGYGQPVVG